MDLRIDTILNGEPNGYAGTPGYQIVGIGCNHFNGDVDQLVREVRDGLQDLFKSNKLTREVPVLIKDLHEDGTELWSPTLAAIIASTAAGVCAKNETPQALFITEQNQFVTMCSNTDTVPIGSRFGANGRFLKQRESSVTPGQTSDETTAPQNQQEQYAGASQQG